MLLCAETSTICLILIPYSHKLIALECVCRALAAYIPFFVSFEFILRFVLVILLDSAHLPRIFFRFSPPLAPSSPFVVLFLWQSLSLCTQTDISRCIYVHHNAPHSRKAARRMAHSNNSTLCGMHSIDVCYTGLWLSLPRLPVVIHQRIFLIVIRYLPQNRCSTHAACTHPFPPPIF